MSTLDVLKPACALRLGSLWPSLEHQPTSPRLCVRGRDPRILVTMRYRLQTSVFCHGGSTLCRRPRYPQSSSSKEGVQDQSSSNRHRSNGTSQHCAILPPAMRNTATVCQVRSWPLRSSWGRPAAPPAGRHELVPSFLTGE